MTGNSHMTAPAAPPAPALVDGKHSGGGAAESNHTGSAPATEEHGKKEKSVLQAKLTKLAIQIGYAGKDYPLALNPKTHVPQEGVQVIPFSVHCDRIQRILLNVRFKKIRLS